jgi:hypothetical protein
MTYIITAKCKESIIMASDSRLNYHGDVNINGILYQEIKAIADCIQKTFYINKAKIGIQFLGIGYFPIEDGSRQPLSYFIKKLEALEYDYSMQNRFAKINDFFKRICIEGNVGQYVKGIMIGFYNGKSFICTFNTFNNQYEVKPFLDGQFVDSENNKHQFSIIESEAIDEIKNRINKASEQNPWSIGGTIDILKIKQDGSYEFIEKNNNIFEGTQEELIHCFNNNITRIKGIIINPPRLEKYNL